MELNNYYQMEGLSFNMHMSDLACLFLKSLASYWKPFLTSE